MTCEQIAVALDAALRTQWLIVPRGFAGSPEEFDEARRNLSRAAVLCVLSAVWCPPEVPDAET